MCTLPVRSSWQISACLFRVGVLVVLTWYRLWVKEHCMFTILCLLTSSLPFFSLVPLSPFCLTTMGNATSAFIYFAWTCQPMVIGAIQCQQESQIWGAVKTEATQWKQLHCDTAQLCHSSVMKQPGWLWNSMALRWPWGVGGPRLGSSLVRLLSGMSVCSSLPSLLYSGLGRHLYRFGFSQRKAVFSLWWKGKMRSLS